jgi:hypothetical protein
MPETRWHEIHFTKAQQIALATIFGLSLVMPFLYVTDQAHATLADKQEIATSTAQHPQSAAAVAADTTVAPAEATPAPELVQYIEVTDSCDPHWGGACVSVRSEPSTTSPKVLTLRKGIVLRVGSVVHAEDRDWYKITFDEWVRYPDRVAKNWYVAADIVNSFTNVGPQDWDHSTSTSQKRIEVDRTKQMLYAYDGDALFMKEPVSTGLDGTPTPRGWFHIYKKTPSRYMQGPVPGISDQEFDLPGVPWTMYFTNEGGAIHGAYWHDSFGQQWSHGCVNLPPEKAKELYEWAPLGAPVYVHD